MRTSRATFLRQDTCTATGGRDADRLETILNTQKSPTFLDTINAECMISYHFETRCFEERKNYYEALQGKANESSRSDTSTRKETEEQVIKLSTTLSIELSRQRRI